MEHCFQDVCVCVCEQHAVMVVVGGEVVLKSSGTVSMYTHYSDLLSDNWS